MNKETRYFIANWKMHISRANASAFAQQLIHAMTSKDPKEGIPTSSKIIILPSFPLIPELIELLHSVGISVGAQDCSAHITGPHTGQVSATLLKELGCSYTIIGHSERRLELHESPAIVSEKAARLLEQGISPIISIGEDRDSYEHGETFHVLERQLYALLPVFGYSRCRAIQPLIAYEPIWAIGTKLVPTPTVLTNTFKWLKEHLEHHCPGQNIPLLYGGSVTDSNSADLLKIPLVNGLLIGGASNDFQTFKKIVSLTS